MSDKYGIFVQGKVDGSYAWRFQSERDAKAEAESIVRKHHVSVIVFEIIGQFEPTVKWTPQEDME